MNRNIRNITTVAQKEFVDNLWSPVLLTMLAVFSLIIIAFNYEYGVIEGDFVGTMVTVKAGIMRGLRMLAYNLGFFLPLFGIALSFDTLLREEKLGSLNVLLTHPLYRDNIIAGKMLGSVISLLLVLLISTLVSVGTLMFFTGESVTGYELTRIAAFFILNLLYVTVFLGIGLLISSLVKDPSDSLVYSIASWLFFTVAFLSVVSAILLAMGMSFEEDGAGGILLTKLAVLSPVYHYHQLMAGIFDASSTLSNVIAEFWMNIAVLIVTPMILFVLSFIAFLRKDITI